MSFCMDWGPQAPLTAFQACRRLLFFSGSQHALFRKGQFSTKNILSIIFDDCASEERPAHGGENINRQSMSNQS